MFLNGFQNSKIWIYTGLYSILMITGLFLSLSTSSGFTLDAVKSPPNNRIQIVYSSPEGDITAEPVTGIRLITLIDNDDNEKVTGMIIRTSIYGDFNIDAENFGLNSKDITYLHTGLSDFLDDDSASELSLKLNKNVFKRLFGLALLFGSGFLLYKNVRKLPDLTKEQKNELKARFKKIGAGAGSIKNAVAQKIAASKNQTSSSGSATQIDSFTEKLLMVLIISHNKENIASTDVYMIPGIKSITVACTEQQKRMLISRNITGIEIITYDKDAKESKILADFTAKTADFKGYVIVETHRTENISSAVIKKLYSFHREKNNECSVLVREDGKDNSLPSVVRNMANRIVKISCSDDKSAMQEETDERFAGILCFNTNRIKEVSEKYFRISSGSGAVHGLIELYGKSGFKTNSFSPFQTEGIRGKEQKTVQLQSSGSAPQAKTCALIITSPDSDSKTLIKLTEAVSVPEIDGSCVICFTALSDTLQDMTDITVIKSNDDLGDGYDALKAHDWLKSKGGNVIVLPLNNNYAPDASVLKKIIDLHYFNANTCTCVNHLKTPVVYCVKTDYFVYAVKRIIKDPETKRYCLEQIVGILENDKKRVEILEINDL